MISERNTQALALDRLIHDLTLRETIALAELALVQAELLLALQPGAVSSTAPAVSFPSAESDGQPGGLSRADT